jgi:hypothetical protein
LLADFVVKVETRAARLFHNAVQGNVTPTRKDDWDGPGRLLQSPYRRAAIGDDHPRLKAYQFCREIPDALDVACAVA